MDAVDIERAKLVAIVQEKYRVKELKKRKKKMKSNDPKPQEDDQQFDDFDWTENDMS
jgi:hypothetical protein